MKLLPKFTKALLTAGVLSLASTAALAAKQTFVLDADHTFPSFSYSHFGLSTQQSKFTSAKGELVLDRKKQTASIKVEIDMNSVETGSAEFDQHIKGADFFDVANYPKATFVGNKAKFVKGEPVAITGKLTIKNVTKEVTFNLNNYLYLDSHPMVEGKAALGANAQVEILRSDFGAGMFAPYVSDEVTLSVAIEAIEK